MKSQLGLIVTVAFALTACGGGGSSSSSSAIPPDIVTAPTAPPTPLPSLAATGRPTLTGQWFLSEPNGTMAEGALPNIALPNATLPPSASIAVQTDGGTGLLIETPQWGGGNEPACPFTIRTTLQAPGSISIYNLTSIPACQFTIVDPATEHGVLVSYQNEPGDGAPPLWACGPALPTCPSPTPIPSPIPLPSGSVSYRD